MNSQETNPGEIKHPIEAPRPPQRTRDLSFDAFRGIAILFVAMAHATVCGFEFHHAEAGRWYYYISISFREFVICAIPMFLFVSGYWLAGTRFESLSDYSAFLRKRLARILIPYLFWSAFFYAVHASRGGPYSAHDFAFKLLTGQVEGLYFFLVMLAQFYVLTPLFIRLSGVRGATWAIVCAHVLFVALLYALRFGYDKNISFTYIKIPFLSWLSLFYMGVIFRGRPDALERVKASWLAGAAALFYLLSLVEGGLLIHYDCFEFGISDIKYTTLLYGAAVVALFFKTRRYVNWPRFLVILGDYSFGIYFIHGFFMRALHKTLMPSIPALYNFQPLYQVTITFAAVGISCVIIHATRKVIGKESAARLLGF